MRLGMVGRMGPVMIHEVGFGDRSTGGREGVILGTNVTNGEFVA